MRPQLPEQKLVTWTVNGNPDLLSPYSQLSQINKLLKKVTTGAEEISWNIMKLVYIRFTELEKSTVKTTKEFEIFNDILVEILKAIGGSVENTEMRALKEM